MADKIDQLKIGDTSYDIDLPPDATPSVASLTTSGNVSVGGSLTKGGKAVATEDTLGQQIIVLEDNGSTTNGTWRAKTNKISSLAAGQLFLYKLIVAGASTTTLNITGSAGTALGAKNVYRYGTTKLGTQYPVGDYILLYYSGTYFKVINDYDANSYAYVRQYQAGASTTGKYSLLARYNTADKSGTYDTAYSRFHTGVTLDTSNGTVDAPNLTINGNDVATKNYVDAKSTTIEIVDLTNA